MLFLNSEASDVQKLGCELRALQEAPVGKSPGNTLGAKGVGVCFFFFYLFFLFCFGLKQPNPGVAGRLRLPGGSYR